MKKRSPSSPSARCPVCNRRVAVRKDGHLRVHGYDPGDHDSQPCPGSPAAVRRDSLHERLATERESQPRPVLRLYYGKAPDGAPNP